MSNAIEDLKALEFSRHRRIWKPFMEKYDCQTIAEVGVFRGENFRRMIEHNPKEAVGVDAWLEDGIVARNDAGFTQEVLDQMYADVCTEFESKPFVKIIREYTFDSVKHFPDEHFDLIYIDGDHTYEGCLTDLEAWYPKVRKGGYLTGDDYTNKKAPNTGVKFGVIQATSEFFAKHGLTVHELPGHGWAVIKK
jgi:hypothetical protein